MRLSDVVPLLWNSLGLLWRFAYGYAWRHPWAVAVAFYSMARALGVVIQSGQRGVLFRWGRVDRELEPGFHWLIPVVHAVRTTHVRSVTIELAAQKVMTADGLVYDVGVNLVYRVDDATKALTLVDHIDAGCRAAVPMIVTELFRVRDQARLVDRVSLDHELTERVGAWVARWGLVVEQAGFTTIAPNKAVLRTTQLRPKTAERARALRLLIDGGLDAGAALVLIGTERRPVGKSSRRYHQRGRRPVGTAAHTPLKPQPPAAPVPPNPAGIPADPKSRRAQARAALAEAKAAKAKARAAKAKPPWQ